MHKAKMISEEELAIFQDAVKDVAPLPVKNQKHPPVREKPSRAKRYSLPHESKGLKELHHLAPTTSDTHLTYKQSSISDKIVRNLKKGQYNVDASLDLHGMIVDEAALAMEAFLAECLTRGVQVALVIHGRGRQGKTPILKNKLNQWLRSIDEVLAFCSATPKHGGLGAIYLLLKTKNRKGMFA